MVKFSKELEAQLIPEWKDAFVNYRVLKKPIKKMKVSKIISKPSQHTDGDFGVSIFDSIRFFAKKISDKFQNSENETDIIQVYIYNNTYTLTCLYICKHVRLCTPFYKIIIKLTVVEVECNHTHTKSNWNIIPVTFSVFSGGLVSGFEFM